MRITELAAKVSGDVAHPTCSSRFAELSQSGTLIVVREPV